MKPKESLDSYFKKTTKNIKDYVPQNINPANIRETTQIPYPETTDFQYTPPLYPNTPFEEWPTDEVIQSTNFEEEKVFTDPKNNLIIFPYSMRNETAGNVQWIRVGDYLKQKKLNREVESNFPKAKSITDIKNKINYYEYINSKPKIERRNSYDVIEKKDIPNYIFSLNESEKMFEEKFNNDLTSNPIKIINNETKKPSNINISRYYCRYIKWIASIFQIIIDNSTEELSLTNCIYPKDENNLPKYNPSGKYWIKLYHMGKYRKVEIDDQIPCNKNNEPFYPECEDENEIWSFLLTKAIMKLYSYKYRNDNYENEEVGDCSVIYSLIKYIGSDVNKDKILSYFENKENTMIEDLLSDENYKSKNKLLIAYTPSQTTSRIRDNFSLRNIRADRENDSSQFKTRKIYQNLRINNPLSFSSCIRLPKINVFNRGNAITTVPSNVRKTLNNTPIVIKNKKNSKLDTGVYVDYAYTIIELFGSKEFNMNRLRPIDFSDLKLNTTKKYKQMNIDEKNEYKIELQQLRQKQKSELKTRINEYILPGNNIYLIKFSNESLVDMENKKKLYEIVQSYTSDEIEMAKYCITNNMDFPPCKYFESTFLPHIFKDEESGEINFWTKKFYEKKILRRVQKQVEENNTEEKKEEEIISVNKRYEGSWIKYDVFKESFNKFLVLVNANYYKNHLIIDNVWYNYTEDIYEQNDSSQIIKITPKPLAEGETLTNDSSVVLLFEPNCEKNNKSVSSGLPLPVISERPSSNKFDDITYSINIQIYSVAEDKQIKRHESVIMKKLFSVKEISSFSKEGEYLMIIKGGITPFGYVLNLFSNAFHFEQYSYNQFLVDYKNFMSKKIQIAHPNLAKNIFYLFSRIKISCSAQKTIKFYTNFINYTDKILRETIEIFLINSITNKKKKIIPKEIIPIDFSSCDIFYIEMSMTPQYAIPSKSFEYEITYENDPSVLVEPVQLIAPFCFSQQYTPNKHAIMLNECIYPTDLSVATLDIWVSYKDKEPLPFDIKMELEFSYDNRIIFTKNFINRTLVRNLVMKGKVYNPKAAPGENAIVPYIIKCYIDINENNEYLFKVSEYQNDIFWNITVFTSEPVLFLKNTIKEDKERAMIESWETNQPGRGELAKVSRKKYFILKKEKTGCELSEEEKEMIHEKKTTIESNSDMIITNIPPLNRMNNVDFKKKNLPTIESYSSIFMRNFYTYSTGERVIILDKNRNVSLPNLNVRCRSEEEKQKQREQIEEEYNNYYSNKKQEDEVFTENCKNYETEIEKILTDTNEKRKKINEVNAEIVTKELNEAIVKIDSINEKVDIMNSILSEVSNNVNSNNTINFQSLYSDLKNVIELKEVKNEYKLSIESIITKLSQIKEQAINKDLIENAKNRKELITKHIADINENILSINKEIIDKANAFLQSTK